MKDNRINNNVIQYAIVILLVLSLCYLVLLYKNEGGIEIIDLDKISPTSDFIGEINALYSGKNSIRLEGVFYKEGEAIDYFNNQVLLRDQESGIVYLLPTESFPKKEIVGEEEEIKYRNILAVAESRKFDFVNRDYEILFLYQSDGVELIQETGYTVANWGNDNEK